MARTSSRVKRRVAKKPAKRQRPPVQSNEPTVETATPPRPVYVERHVPTLEELFGGPRPATFSRGLEPAFLLIDKEVMEQLRTRAMALGLSGYDSLVKRILWEHVHEY
jgi:hypothetical protein